MISRRNFIRFLLCTGIANNWTIASASRAHAAAPLLAVEAGTFSSGFFSDREALEKVVRGYLETNPQEADTARLLELLHISNGTVNAISRQRHLMSLRERDFETGEVLFIDGWMISRTEARLCVLASKWI